MLRQTQQRLRSLHVRWYIVDPLSVSLDTLRAGTWQQRQATAQPTIAPSFSFCKVLEMLLPHADVIYHFLHNTDLHCSPKWNRDCSFEWHCHRSFGGIAIDRSERAEWPRDRSPCSTSDDCMAQIRTILVPWSSILAWERTSQWNSNLSYERTLGADHPFSAFDAEVNGRMTGADLDAQRTSTGQNRVFGKACHDKLFQLGLLFFFRAARVSTVQWFDKTIKSVSKVPSPAIDKASEVKRKNVCKSKPWRLARKTKHSLRDDHFRSKYRYFDHFSSAVFNHFPLEDFFSNQRESIS